MKPRLLLLNPPAARPTLRDDFCSSTSKAGYLWQPIDLICQSGYLDADYDLRLLDAPAARTAAGPAEEAIVAWRPEAIFSLTGSAAFPEDFEFLGRVAARLPAARLFVGGDLARFHPDWVLAEYPFIEGVVLDFTRPALRDCLAGRPADRSALARRGETVSPLPLAAGEFSYPWPRHDLFWALPYRMPFLGRPFASVLTNYGCANSCAYCNSCRIGFARRSFDNLFAELDRLDALGIRHLFVKDFTFNQPPARARELLQTWAARRYRFRWTGYLRAETIDAELAALLARTGCAMAQIGLETANQTALAAARPGADLARAREGIAHLRRAGVSSGAHFIFGLPGDGEAGYAATIALAESLPLAYASFNHYTSRPGARLAADSPATGIARLDPSGQAAADPALTRWVGLAYRRFYRRPAYWFSLWRSARAAGSLAALWSMGVSWLAARLRKAA